MSAPTSFSPVKPQGCNVASWLRRRETRPTNRRERRQVFKAIHPTTTLYEVELPNIVLRKFSPDGKKLIAFTQNGNAVEAYDYEPEKVHAAAAVVGKSVEAFDTVFDRRWETTLTTSRESLCLDFLLFTKTQKHIIVVTSCPSTSTDPTPQSPATLSGLSILEDVTFWILDVETGKVTDFRRLCAEYIMLKNHAGVHLRRDTLGIVSVKHQCIYLLHIKDNGKFGGIRNIGWYVNETDEILQAKYRNAEQQHTKRRKTGLSRRVDSGFCDEMYDALPRKIASSDNAGPAPSTPSISVGPPALRNGKSVEAKTPQTPSWKFMDLPSEWKSDDFPLSGLKHRILAFSYLEARNNKSSGHMHNFHQSFTTLSKLVMSRMQFLSDDQVLIKFGAPVITPGTRPDNANLSRGCLYVVYCISSATVLGIYEQASERLYAMLQNVPELFGAPNPFAQPYITHPCDSLMAREALRKQFAAVKKAKNGGPAEALKRASGPLPYNNQCFIESPYLDQDSFSYDTRLVNNYDRPRPAGEFPAKFFDRASGRLKFKLDSDERNAGRWGWNIKRYVVYIFHPTDPFIISIQHRSTNLRPIVNFHVRSTQIV
ncbi:De-etiolated protein 1 Det1-domain-containing protein [Fimicolochytrium jonesii]|uniref:De-etiolated protein 1 Det1-domain-containing protein n=1 Tax=Fimicolochytrium jonesii TaxID=1396493 RepID=UPI0022FE33DB|nr:De-etiolated protein 1 Det1-domain-containing protein [Fimicolochytrium jonesii]KAI8819208.1 De-etiolated protein 1 Det1-domain-containing protein [Fimicolochytrium jonesii]